MISDERLLYDLDINMGEPPEVWEECPDCCGEGFIDRPQPFHDDPYFCMVILCETCQGAGGFICEARGQF